MAKETQKGSLLLQIDRVMRTKNNKYSLKMKINLLVHQFLREILEFKPKNKR